jgi:hypothetical protein
MAMAFQDDDDYAIEELSGWHGLGISDTLPSARYLLVDIYSLLKYVGPLDGGDISDAWVEDWLITLLGKYHAGDAENKSIIEQWLTDERGGIMRAPAPTLHARVDDPAANKVITIVLIAPPLFSDKRAMRDAVLTELSRGVEMDVAAAWGGGDAAKRGDWQSVYKRMRQLWGKLLRFHNFDDAKSRLRKDVVIRWVMVCNGLAGDGYAPTTVVETVVWQPTGTDKRFCDMYVPGGIGPNKLTGSNGIAAKCVGGVIPIMARFLMIDPSIIYNYARSAGGRLEAVGWTAAHPLHSRATTAVAVDANPAYYHTECIFATANDISIGLLGLATYGSRVSPLVTLRVLHGAKATRKQTIASCFRVYLRAAEPYYGFASHTRRKLGPPAGKNLLLVPDGGAFDGYRITIEEYKDIKKGRLTLTRAHMRESVIDRIVKKIYDHLTTYCIGDACLDKATANITTLCKMLMEFVPVTAGGIETACHALFSVLTPEFIVTLQHLMITETICANQRATQWHLAARPHDLLSFCGAGMFWMLYFPFIYSDLECRQDDAERESKVRQCLERWTLAQILKPVESGSSARVSLFGGSAVGSRPGTAPHSRASGRSGSAVAVRGSRMRWHQSGGVGGATEEKTMGLMRRAVGSMAHPLGVQTSRHSVDAVGPVMGLLTRPIGTDIPGTLYWVATSVPMDSIEARLVTSRPLSHLRLVVVELLRRWALERSARSSDIAAVVVREVDTLVSDGVADIKLCDLERTLLRITVADPLMITKILTSLTCAITDILCTPIEMEHVARRWSDNSPVSIFRLLMHMEHKSDDAITLKGTIDKITQYDAMVPTDMKVCAALARSLIVYLWSAMLGLRGGMRGGMRDSLVLGLRKALRHAAIHGLADTPGVSASAVRWWNQVIPGDHGHAVASDFAVDEGELEGKRGEEGEEDNTLHAKMHRARTRIAVFFHLAEHIWEHAGGGDSYVINRVSAWSLFIEGPHRLGEIWSNGCAGYARYDNVNRHCWSSTLSSADIVGVANGSRRAWALADLTSLYALITQLSPCANMGWAWVYQPNLCACYNLMVSGEDGDASEWEGRRVGDFVIDGRGGIAIAVV